MSEFRYYLGLDLGQVSDFSALVLAEASSTEPGVFYLRSAHRYELRTPYTAVAASVADALANPSLAGQTALLVDSTGVGRAVVDVLKDTRLSAPLYELTITAGEHVSRERNAFRVPKKDLASAVQISFEQSLIRIPTSLPFAEVLKTELKNFKVRINAATGNTSYEAWREHDHDDLVLSVAMALWAGGQKLRRRMLQGFAEQEARKVAEQVAKNGTREMITTTPLSEEELLKSQEGWRLADVLLSGRWRR